MSDTQQEPSMEEILASIRKIISEDGEVVAEDEVAGPELASEPEPEPEPAPAPEPEPEPEPMPEPEPEVVEEPPAMEEEPLELTEVVEEEAADIEMVDSEPEPETAPVPVQEPEPRVDVPVQAAMADVERIISDDVADASAASLLRLVNATQIGNTTLTLEELLKEILRPMLREWLDANLSNMVETLVREEIEKLSAQARGR